MLTLGIPTLLALFGTALMALVIFAPERALAGTAISYAPPFAPQPLERRYDRFDEPPEPPATTFPLSLAPARWPALVDPRAAGCDAGARLGLVDALATVRAPWAQRILRSAFEEETDPAVRAALEAALTV